MYEENRLDGNQSKRVAVYVALFGLRVALVLLGCVISLPRLHFANYACYNMGNYGGGIDETL